MAGEDTRSINELIDQLQTLDETDRKMIHDETTLERVIAEKEYKIRYNFSIWLVKT